MIASSLRVTIADEDDGMETALRKLGHRPLALARTSVDLCRRARLDKPDLVVANVRLAPDGIEAVEKVYLERPVPIILASATRDVTLIDHLAKSHALAYLVKPVEPVDLQVAITVALRCFGRIQDLERQLEERKLAERAKGILVRLLAIDEEKAYRKMQKYASDKNMRIADVARLIVASAEPFNELSQLGVSAKSDERPRHDARGRPA